MRRAFKESSEKAEEKDMTEAEQSAVKEVKGFEEKFDAAMDDDFNTADAISAIFEPGAFCECESDGRKYESVCKSGV